MCKTIAFCWSLNVLTHSGRVMHICVGKLPTIGSDDGLSPGWHQAIIWINAGILLIGPLSINFSEIFIDIATFSFKKMHLKVSSAKWRPCCLGLNVLISNNTGCGGMSWDHVVLQRDHMHPCKWDKMNVCHGIDGPRGFDLTHWYQYDIFINSFISTHICQEDTWMAWC